MAQQSVTDVDQWIEKLYACKSLTENEVKMLCEKVRLPSHFHNCIVDLL
jgi:hypothetical protein